MDHDTDQNAECTGFERGSVARWWETAEDHRFALQVLQLKLRRQILRFIGSNRRSIEEIRAAFEEGSVPLAYHLEMLEKALVIERIEGGYRATPTGLLYLERVDARRSDVENDSP